MPNTIEEKIKERIQIMRQGGMEVSPAIEIVILKEAEMAYERGLEKVWDLLFSSYPPDMENFETRTEDQSHRLLGKFFKGLESLHTKREE